MSLPISPLSKNLLKFTKSISVLRQTQLLILLNSNFKESKIDTKKNKKSKSILNKS